MRYERYVTVGVFPSGKFYHPVRINKKVIGIYREVEGGFLPTHSRKSVGTQEEAVDKLVLHRIRELEKEAAFLREILL